MAICADRHRWRPTRGADRGLTAAHPGSTAASSAAAPALAQDRPPCDPACSGPGRPDWSHAARPRSGSRRTTGPGRGAAAASRSPTPPRSRSTRHWLHAGSADSSTPGRKPRRAPDSPTPDQHAPAHSPPGTRPAHGRTRRSSAEPAPDQPKPATTDGQLMPQQHRPLTVQHLHDAQQIP